MPSDNKKKRDARKKELAKAKNETRNGKKEETSNGATNGTSEEPDIGKLSLEETDNMTSEEKLCFRLQEEARLAAEARACTGVLGIHPMARDIKIDNFSVTFYGAELLGHQA